MVALAGLCMFLSLPVVGCYTQHNKMPSLATASPQGLLHALMHFHEKDGHCDLVLCGALGLMVAFVLYSYVRISMTKEASVIDRMWSIVPPVYALYYISVGWWLALRDSTSDVLNYNFYYLQLPNTKMYYYLPTLKLVWMLVLPTLWGFRLTYHFYRRGGYKPGAEDYRWAYVREGLPKNPVVQFLFDFVVLSVFMHIVLFALVLPMYAVLRETTQSNLLIARMKQSSALKSMRHQYIHNMSLLDYACVAAFLFFLVIEAIADQQQFNFQSSKYGQESRGAMYQPQKKLVEGEKSSLETPQRLGEETKRLGFNASGLFSVCRHPNFFAEMMMWWSYYGLAAGLLNHLVLAGPLMLTIIFHFSTSITERISASKYADYRQYQETVTRLIPSFPRVVQNLSTCCAPTHKAEKAD